MLTSLLIYISAAFIEAFLNEIVETPLPVDCVAYVRDFLQLPDDSMNSSSRAYLDHFSPTSRQYMSNDDNQMLEGLKGSSKCFSQYSADLVKAYEQSLIAISTLECMHRKITAIDDTENALPCVTQPYSLPLPSNQLSDGIYSILNEMMKERDEAQSRLYLAEILHQQEKDELNLRVNDLESQLEATKRSQDVQSDKNLSDDKSASSTYTKRHSIANRGIYDSDLELQSLCQQLAGEISARTAADLSLVRMKELRKIEQDRETSERQALQDEVVKLREMVQQMSARENEIVREVRMWRESFEALVHFNKENNTKSSPSTPPS